MALLEEIGSAVQAAAEQAGPSVVGIGRGWGVGSGIVIGPGLVLTNAHNLRHDEVSVTFSDGRQVPAKVAGSDPDMDIAVLSADTGETTPLPWLEQDDSETELSVGRPVLALGNPGGRGLRVTPGFVSTTARSFRGPRGRRIAGAIEHTAPLPRGSSGGPLLGTDGTLLGINAIRVDGGLILAIPADAALRQRVSALARGEAPKRLRLGVALVPPRAARKLRHAVGLPARDGVLVRGVEEDSPAGRAGIERGDLIVAAAGREIDRTSVLYDALEGARDTNQLELTVVRGAEERAVTVTF